MNAPMILLVFLAYCETQNDIEHRNRRDAPGISKVSVLNPLSESADGTMPRFSIFSR